MPVLCALAALAAACLAIWLVRRRRRHRRTAPSWQPPVLKSAAESSVDAFRADMDASYRRKLQDDWERDGRILLTHDMRKERRP